MAKYLFPTVCSIVFVSVVPIATTGTSAEIPGKIDYQARLADTESREPLEETNDLEFRLYNSATEGDLLWWEAQSVDIDSLGIISVILGRETEIDLSFDRPVWLEVVVAGEVLTPRRELASVPYAFLSRKSGGSDSLGGVSSGDYVLQGEAGVVTSEMISDGAGSGLDADMLDGLDSDAFADSGHSHDDRYYSQEDTLNHPPGARQYSYAVSPWRDSSRVVSSASVVLTVETLSMIQSMT